jgi:adenylyltransferase/sulfurtransferase
MIIPGIGAEGQRRLKAATVFIAGLGGLGSGLAFYMAAAGVGRLRLIDRDRVALSNLNRQLLHTTNDLDRAKTASAAEKLRALNPRCRIDTFCADLQEVDLDALAAGSNLILDGTDNVAARRALNRVSLRSRIPFLYGGIDGFNGMVSTFIPGRTPCFQCLFAAVTPHGGPIGALGAMAGLVAAMQCLEAVKLLLAMPPSFAGRLLTIAAQEMAFRNVTLARDPACPACSRSNGRD